MTDDTTIGDAALPLPLAPATLEAIRERVYHGYAIEPGDAFDLLAEIDRLRPLDIDRLRPLDLELYSMRDAMAVLVQVCADGLDEKGAENGIVTAYPQIGLELIVQRIGRPSVVEILYGLRARVAELEAERDRLRAALAAFYEREKGPRT